MKKLILLIVVGIFLINLVSAEQQSLGVFKQGECIQLKQTCDNCTYVNLTAVSNPNSLLVINDENEMTKVGNIYNYTFCNTTLLGEYIYTTCGDLDGTNFCGNVNFEITSSGRKSPTSGEGIIYISSLIAMLLFSIIFLFVSNSFKVERETARGENGEETIITKGNSAMRFGCLALSIIGLLFVVLYSSISLTQMLGGFEGVTKIYDTFLYIFLAILLIMFIFVLVAITFSLLEKMQRKKGLKE